ncbi:hypothetical protein KC644_04280 [Candidatus Berkelbacteria bacterium]|nr:hypothetical protein [Candidatus Berkelbacteria bacterium]
MIIQFLRQFKIGQFAVFDLVTAFLGVWLVSPWLSAGMAKLGLIVPRSSWLWWTLPLGTLVHIIIGTNTPLTSYVLDPKGYYLWKLALVILILIGAIQVKTK